MKIVICRLQYFVYNELLYWKTIIEPVPCQFATHPTEKHNLRIYCKSVTYVGTEWTLERGVGPLLYFFWWIDDCGGKVYKVMPRAAYIGLESGALCVGDIIFPVTDHLPPISLGVVSRPEQFSLISAFLSFWKFSWTGYLWDQRSKKIFSGLVQYTVQFCNKTCILYNKNVVKNTD